MIYFARRPQSMERIARLVAHSSRVPGICLAQEASTLLGPIRGVLVWA